jgi:hypothetical protein
LRAKDGRSVISEVLALIVIAQDHRRRW